MRVGFLVSPPSQSLEEYTGLVSQVSGYRSDWKTYPEFYDFNNNSNNKKQQQPSTKIC